MHGGLPAGSHADACSYYFFRAHEPALAAAERGAERGAFEQPERVAVEFSHDAAVRGTVEPSLGESFGEPLVDAERRSELISQRRPLAVAEQQPEQRPERRAEQQPLGRAELDSVPRRRPGLASTRVEELPTAGPRRRQG